MTSRIIREKIYAWLDRHDADRLIRHSALVIFLTNIGSVTNLLFHMIMMRMLLAGYAELSAMLNVFVIFTTPTLALQNTVAHFAGYLDQCDRRGDIRRLAAHWLWRISLALVPLVAAALVFSPYWASMLHLASIWPVVTVAFMIVLGYIMAVYVGALQGIQSFFWMCMSANTWTLVRIVLSYLLIVFVGAWAIAGLLGHLAGFAVSILIGLWVFKKQITTEKTEIPLESSDSYLFRSMVCMLSFSVLMAGDMVLVKILFPSDADVGPYAKASTIARSLIFLCQPIAGALFPKVISKGGRSRAHDLTLWKAIGLSALILSAAVLICALCPRLLLRILSGISDADATLVSLVRRVSLAMAPLGLAYILMNFELAQHRFHFMLPLCACATFLPAAAWFFHATLFQFVAVYSIAAYAAAAVLIAAQFIRPGPRPPPDGQGAV